MNTKMSLPVCGQAIFVHDPKQTKLLWFATGGESRNYVFIAIKTSEAGSRKFCCNKIICDRLPVGSPIRELVRALEKGSDKQTKTVSFETVFVYLMKDNPLIITTYIYKLNEKAAFPFVVSVKGVSFVLTPSMVW